MGADLPPGRVPFIEPLQLYPQNGGLQCVETAVETDFLVMIFHRRATIAQHPDAFGDVSASCGDQATVAVGAQIFPGVEAEAADVAEAPGSPAPIDCPVRLRRVFDDPQ